LLLVGLTGGIGAGKSTVARLLASKGAVVVDTDAVARQVTRPGTPTHLAILGRFGDVVEGPNGEIDRARLADVVFADPAALADLNAIVHPAVAAAVDERLAEEADAGSGQKVVVLEVPLLIEAGWDARADVVIVVDVPEDVAVRRLVEQRAMPEADVRRRIASQASREERLRRADIVITNDGSLEDLARRVDEVWVEMTTR
jgi:dephospho-CoA kinase